MTTLKSLTAILLCLPYCALTQHMDSGSWVSCGVEKKLTKGLTGEAIAESRFGDQFSNASSVFTDLVLTYKLHDNIKIGGVYRIGLRSQADGYYLPRHRFAIDLMIKHSINDWKFGYRLRYQNNNSALASSESGIQYESGYRNKLSVSRKLMKRTWLKAQGEIFSSQIDDLIQPTDYRLKLGVTRGVKKRHDLSLGLLYQTEIDNSDPNGEFIIYLGYSIELKKKKKKKSDSQPQ